MSDPRRISPAVTVRPTAAPLATPPEPLPRPVSTTVAVGIVDGQYLDQPLQVALTSEPYNSPERTGIPPVTRAISVKEAQGITDAQVMGMDAAFRGRLVAGLARTLRDMPATDPARRTVSREALRILLGAPDTQSLTDTFLRLVKSRELGMVVDGLGLDELIALCNRAQYGIDFNAIAAQSDTVRERGLTQDERRYAEDIFGSTLIYDAVRLRFTTGTLTTGSHAMVLGNVVNIDPSTGVRFSFKPGTTLPTGSGQKDFNNTVLAHELAHVWQYQHVGSRYLSEAFTAQVNAIVSSGDRNGAYNYTLDPKRTLASYNPEQQAKIIEHYDAVLRRVNTGKLPNTALEPYEPYIRELRSAGVGREAPALQSLPCPCPHAHGEPSDLAGDGAAQALATYFPVLARQLGQEAKNALERGDYATATAILGGAAVFAYQRGSVVLEEFGLPNTIRFGDKNVGIAVGGMWGRQFSNAAGILSVDAGGQLGSYQLNSQFTGVINGDGPREGRFMLSGQGDTSGFNVAGRIDSTGAQGAFSVQAGAFETDGNVSFGAGHNFDAGDVNARYRLDETLLGAGASVDENGMAEGRVSGSTRIGATSVAGSMTLDANGRPMRGTAAATHALSRGYAIVSGVSFAEAGLSTLRAGIVQREGDVQTALIGSYTEARKESAVELTGSTPGVQGFVRASTSDVEQRLTLGASGIF